MDIKNINLAMHHQLDCVHIGGLFNDIHLKFKIEGVSHLSFIDQFKIHGFISANQHIKFKFYLGFKPYEALICICNKYHQSQSLPYGTSGQKRLFNFIVDNMGIETQRHYKGENILSFKIKENNFGDCFSDIPVKCYLNNIIQFPTTKPTDKDFLISYNNNRGIIENYFSLPLQKINKLSYYQLTDLLIKKFRHDTRKQQKSFAFYI